MKESNIKCPCCNEKLFVCLEDDKILFVKKENEISLSEDEIKKLSGKHGLEFG